jgi:hypothetical protein
MLIRKRMKGGRMKRSRFVFLSLGLALGILVTVTSATGGLSGQRSGHIVRWDFAQVIQGTGLAGGTDVGLDAASGDTISLTGSGHAKPARHRAFGGGTFVHTDSEGNEVAHGVYVVTGFVSWQSLAGTFPPPMDGIGNIRQAHAGVLVLDVRFFPEGGSPVDGVLTINCHFPDTPADIEEGFELSVGSFTFTPAGGLTLFHVFK